MALTKCPAEILFEIAQLVPDKDTYKFALINRRCYTTVERLLHRRVLIDSPDQTYKFLQVILDRPAIGEKVQSLYFDYAAKEWWPESDAAPFRDHAGRFAEVAEGLDLGEALVTAARASNPEAVALILLHYVPNLKKLRMHNLFDKSLLDRFMIPELRARHGSEKFLGSLQHFISSHWDTECGTELHSYIPFLFLPSMQEIHLHMTTTESWGVGDRLLVDKMSDLYGTSPVTVMEFTYSVINGDALAKILRLPRQLKRLVYDVSGPVVSYEDIGIVEIGHALRIVRRTVEELVFSVEDENSFSDFDDESDGIGSLREFTALRDLTVFIPALPPGDLGPLLPESLKSVIFQFGEYGDKGKVLRLLQRKSEFVPELEAIFVSGFNDADRQEIQAAAEKVGLKYESRGCTYKFDEDFPFAFH